MRQGAAVTPYVDDVFSAYTYTGNGTAQTITNGIDLAGKGGLVWSKTRNDTIHNSLIDTISGNTKYLITDTTDAQLSNATNITSFTSNGYVLGSGVFFNASADTYINWTFRKAAKFFDVVTYIGNNTSQTITHSLGIAPGMIIIKNLDSSYDWQVYHRSTGTSSWGYLNTTAAFGIANSPGFANVTSTSFDVGSYIAVNGGGSHYVAYLFAHDTSANGIIQCGNFTTDGSGNATVTLGWEPQYVLTKRTDSSTLGQWYINDTSRGMAVTTGATGSAYLTAESSSSEAMGGVTYSTSTGFMVGGCYGNQTNIYMAIRRPNKPPTVGTQVYNAIARTGTGVAATVTGVGFAPDLALIIDRSSAQNDNIQDRMRGASQTMRTATTEAEFSSSTTITSFNMDGVSLGVYSQVNGSGDTYINWFFKRAPGVFDIVCYTWNGPTVVDIPHSLSAVPEMILTKRRDAAGDWMIYHKDLVRAQTYPWPRLNGSEAGWFTEAIYPTNPLISTYRMDNQSTGIKTYVSYLFATKAGISKVGTYNGTNASQNINCGFTAGPRFLMIKRTDAVGDWYVWDSTRGITTLAGGNDPHLSLNSVAVEVTTDDSIDSYINGSNSGFTVKQNATTNLNLYLTISTASYIYLAIA